MVNRSRGRGPATGVWILPTAISLTVLILLAGLAAPYLPATGDARAPWDFVQRALGFEAQRSVPGWWSTALPVLAATAAFDTAALRRRVRARAGWLLLGLVLAWLSLDHLLTIHVAMGRVRLPILGPLAGFPVEAALVLVGVVAGLLLLTSEGLSTGLLLCLAGLLYGVSVMVDLFGVPVAMSPHHGAMVEVGLSWLALLVVLLATRTKIVEIASVAEPDVAVGKMSRHGPELTS